jgi:pimeloyl-ACP methyl ester carboxylesterase
MGPRHSTWDHLPEIATDVLVMAGRVDAGQPSMISAQVAHRLPHGRYLQFDDLDHFGPMARPLLVADAIAQALS